MSKLITGSLSQVAEQNNQSLAETFMSCDVLLIADMSSSMDVKDAKGKRSRYDVAEDDIVRLQGKYSGKVGLICFGDENSPVMLCPTGKPNRIGGGTDLVKALNYIKIADDTGIQFIIISDGLPNAPYEALEIAKTFISKIDCVYVGDERDVYGGRAFLNDLAAATGGQSLKSNTPGLLQSSVEKLMIGA